MTKELKRVVITGMGAVTPLGNSVDASWKNIVAGKSGADFITKFDTTHFKTKFAAEVKGFSAGTYFEKNEARKYDLFTQYAIATAAPHAVDYINAHATSTPMGDESELKAIARMFGERSSLNISGTKSMTGHLLGTAGAVEAIIAAKSVQEDIVPPTINTNEVEPAWKDKFNLTLGTAHYKVVNYAMSNTFGFGGHIASVLFKKYK